eukprot:CAMPEP_0205831176 /NCGR_PEP_ID=MMETSP0206-20130828/43293_1 /ASSEMBLY_ACC=CAM_ASM_000279 /TAXON_ID=36767 /ORGANISM="Euplotes focardii, Strain TN1" /LENGTH=242 /DNA_ID=CAMNT_0053135553 /DNA_START=92 /DNA_END=816 /DNA_ORIENTATION=-
MFSSEDGDIKKEYEEITEGEKQKYRDAWGLKFDDECIKFEKEWEEIAKDRDEEQMRQLDERITDAQKKKCEFLADKFMELNTFEARYMAAYVKDVCEKTTGINPLKLNMDWPSVKIDADGTWPPLNPNWFKQQDLMAQLGPLMGSFGGGGAAPAESEGAGGENEEKEAVQEKTNFDVELSSFDPKSKIKLIKELRSLFDLGLKDAKEMVESAPCWLKKDVKKEDADEWVAKLTSLGAEIKLA